MGDGALARIAAFLDGIGLPPRAATLDGDTFLPGIRITRGELVYDPARIAWPTDLLHEAGHIALAPAAHRAALDDALTAEQHFGHGGEVESIAWSYAASVRLALPPSTIVSASETFLPPRSDALNSDWMASSRASTRVSSAGSLTAQSFCGASRTRAPFAPPRRSVPR